MFDIPGFSPSGMTDDELMNRQIEINRRLAWASRFSSGASEQLLSMSLAIENERRDRLLRAVFEQRNAMTPDIIESEPELAAENKLKSSTNDEDAMTKRRKVGRERITLTKTASPTSEPQFPLYRTENKSESTENKPENGDDNG